MAKATIKSNTGAVITIEGSDSEVSKILSSFERTESVTQAKKVKEKGHKLKTEEKKRSSASDLIVELKEDEFFAKPKALGEISRALEEKGFLYPVTTLSGVVLTLVQKKLLRRKKIEGRWVYGK